MSILKRHSWIQDHINLYKSDPERAHYFQSSLIEEPTPTLLLTTIGRKSGKPRDVPLIYGAADGRFFIVASLGGAPDHPIWYKNLQAEPNAEIQVGVNHYKVRARDARDDERANIWAIMVKIFPTYTQYKRATEGIREIPLIVLERRDN